MFDCTAWFSIEYFFFSVGLPESWNDKENKFKTLETCLGDGNIQLLLAKRSQEI